MTGASITHRRLGEWAGRAMQNTFGVQVRNDDITSIGLYHTEARRLLDTVRQDSVVETSAGAYAQNEIAMESVAADAGGHPRATAIASMSTRRVRSTAAWPAPVSSARKAASSFGPFKGTELYVNAGNGFHSNDARGATITVDPVTGEAAHRVTPLVRATGAEAGVRTVAVPHLQTTFTVWSLDLASELVFSGDAGTTEAGRPSHRAGIELANYYRPRRWLTLDGDVSLSHARFTDVDVAGDNIPGSLETVVSAGATIDALHNVFGSVRLRYFGPRPLIEDNSVRSKATTLVNLDGGYRLAEWCEDRGRCVQSLQRTGQRRRLLLRFASAGRASGRRQRHPLSSDRCRAPRAST